ncbi:MAG TPA: hypothetical protein PK668_15535 [Myxococcota bacterium]|nr:hypothetical protein [Myxococcota bacterium]HRY94307.1 hypothetical protein [Myxococcota bacterium]HSA23798.1 hypothetical protein [Myxococcota bacterium]
MPPRACLPWLVALAALAWPVALRAHQGEHPLTLRMLLKPDGLHVAMDFSLPPGEPARAWREACDANRDRRLDAGEARACLAAQRAKWRAGLAVRFGEVAPAPEERPDEGLGLVGPADSQAGLSASLQLFYPFAAGAQPVALVLHARPHASGQDVPTFLQVGRGLRLHEHNARAFERAGFTMLEALVDLERPLALRYGRASGDGGGG